MNRYEICWLAGLLEGEGCFDEKRYKNSSTCSPRIQVNMTDRDVVERVAQMFNANVLGPYGVGRADNPNASPYYAASIQGRKAAEIMMLVKPYMMTRRAARIDEVLAASTISL